MNVKAAIYARLSTDRQNESSIEQQVRACADYATRQGWAVVKTYDDKGISGAALGNRPGIRQLQMDAERRAFEVLLVTDLSRLSRNQGDLPKLVARVTQRRIRVIGIQDGTDTSRKGYKLQVGVSGIIGEAFREMVKERTSLSLRLRAEQGYHTGGVAYGYISVLVDPAEPKGYKRLQIEKGQAAFVRRIYELYAGGHSPRSIAARLNAEGVPSPGAKWKRTKRRADGKWLASAVLTILGNELYTGRVMYGRRQFIKDDDSGLRSATAPTEAVIERHEHRLRLVSDELWHRVRGRQAAQAHRIGEGVKRGLSQAAALRDGTGSRYLLSGLMRCAHCGSAFAINAKDRYGCSGHRSGGNSLCNNSALMRREVAEAGLLSGLKSQLRSPELVAEIFRRVRATLRQPRQQAPKPSAARIAKLKAEVENLADAIASGALRSSPTLAARLSSAEEELQRLTAAQPAAPRPKPKSSSYSPTCPSSRSGQSTALSRRSARAMCRARGRKLGRTSVR